MPLWVISRPFALQSLCPLYRQRRTFAKRGCDVRQALEPDIRRSRHATLHANLSARPEEPGGVAFFTIDRRALSGLATMPPVVADGQHGTQIESGHSSNGIEPALAFDANQRPDQDDDPKSVGQARPTEERFL